MKKFFITIMACATLTAAHAQSSISTSFGVYAPLYVGAAAINSGGSIWVGDGGNWGFGGNITGTDKGNDNAPNSTGRSETIVFSGTGTYTNADTAVGTNGYIVDGYAGVNNRTDNFILPIGTGSTAYPVTVPANVTSAAAYFTGAGGSQTTSVNGTATTEYSPYIDIDNLPAGNYTFSYPAGFDANPFSSLLESGNTSGSGTSSNTQYNLLYNANPFSAGGGRITMSVPKDYSSTQIYFATSAASLPVRYAAELTVHRQGTSAVLNWSTASEINNKGFSIRRSADGKTFKDIGYINSKAINGNSSETLSYTYTDAIPVTGAVNYYRLVQTDFDGHATESRIVQADFTGIEDGISLYPNPAHGGITVSGLQINSKIAIYKINGQQVKNIIASSATRQIDISGLVPGIYILKVLHGTNAKAITFTVK